MYLEKKVHMGGFLSGRKAGMLTVTLEDRPRLRLTRLKAAGLMLPGARGTIFTDNLRPQGRHELWVERSAGHLAVYFLGAASLQSQEIEMQEQACNYGAGRFYMTCPGVPGRDCAHKCMDLYLTGAGFVCRRCSGLIYKSQTFSAPHLKALARITAIHAKMGLPPGSALGGLLPDKPKRMRFSTYFRIGQALLTAHHDLDRHFDVHQGKMLEAVDRIGHPRPRRRYRSKEGVE